MHLVHQPGQGPEPFPLILTRGWPGSFLAYLDQRQPSALTTPIGQETPVPWSGQ